MRHYHIFLIEDEIAQMYFGEESKLFQLFLEAENTTSLLKTEVLQKQIRYVTKSIDQNALKKVLEESLQHRTDFFVNPNDYLLEKGQSQAKLTIEDPCVHINSAGTPDTEATFFEQLRKIESSFLAMDFQHHRYGWLNPIKQANFIS